MHSVGRLRTTATAQCTLVLQFMACYLDDTKATEGNNRHTLGKAVLEDVVDGAL